MEAEKKALGLLREKLIAEGFDHVRFYIEHTQKFNLNVMEGAAEKTVRSSEKAYFVEAGKDGKHCSTFFNNLEMMEDVVEQMQISALGASEKDDPLLPFAEGQDWNQEFCPAQEPEVVDILAQAEQIMYSDKRISCVDHCGCSQSFQEIILMDENGTTLRDCQQSCSLNMSVISRENGDTEIAWSDRSGERLAGLDAKALAQEVKELGTQRLHAKPIPSGKYQVILKNSSAAELLEAYLPIFYGSEIQNDMSGLKGKEGQRISIDDLNLVEDPALAHGRVHRHFDDEGTPVSKKYLIRKGRLEAILYNRKTAAKEEKSSTGNGFKENIRSSVGTAVTNVVMENISGNTFSMEQLCEKMENGLIVTGLEGVFAGANTITGAFSLLCKGLVVENGKAAKPFCEVTIAGNIYDLLMEIEAMGNDPISTESGSQYLECPSLLLKGLAVSGL